MITLKQILSEAVSPVETIQKEIDKLQDGQEQELSDGAHTFAELYEQRMAYNAALFNLMALEGKYDVHKSWKHNDGELCFGGGWFIVCATLDDGQISNHYPEKDWDNFKIPETPKAKHEFDGHTAQDVIDRLLNL